jgi:hypothetical protein
MNKGGKVLPGFCRPARRERRAHPHGPVRSAQRSWTAKDQSIFFYSPYAGTTGVSSCIEMSCIMMRRRPCRDDGRSHPEGKPISAFGSYGVWMLLGRRGKRMGISRVGSVSGQGSRLAALAGDFQGGTAASWVW